MSNIPIANLRLVGRNTNFLDRKVGSRGEVFYDQQLNELRLYDGDVSGGFALARTDQTALPDLSNVDNAAFKTKAESAGVIGGATINATPPTAPQFGQLWFDVDTGVLYVYYNDGTSNQWVQPASIQYGTSGSGGGGGSSDSFATISVAGQSNVVADSATDTLTLVAGSGIAITTNAATDTLTISNTVSSTLQNVFTTIGVSGQSDVVADSSTDTLTLVAGPNITITTNAGNDSITISAAAAGGGGTVGVSSGQANRLAYYASTGTIVQDTGANLTWTGTNLNIIGSITASAEVSYVRAYFDTLAELQQVSPSTWHGMVAHVHEGVGRMYYAHGGAWRPIANQSDLINNFSTVAVSGQANVVADQLSDILTLTAGSGISIATNSSTDTITISATGGGGTASDSFTTIAVAGQSNVVADSATDTLTLVAGTNISLTTNAGTDTITINATAVEGTVSNSFTTVAVEGQSSVVADSSTDTLTLIAGANVTITTNAGNDSITINAASGEGGTASNSFATVSVPGQSSVVADSATDTLTLVAGTGMSISTDAGTDTITINSTVSSGATAFTGLSDRSDLTVDRFYLPAITALATTNNSASSYRFDQYGTADNPTIYAINGTTIAFNLNVSGHPFVIRDSSLPPANYNTGLVHVTTGGVVTTGASAQGKTSGTLYWKIPASISGNYGYYCSSHALAMFGTIVVKNFVSI